MFFKCRFLSCNSHHVRENLERPRPIHVHSRRNVPRRATVNLGGERSQSLSNSHVRSETRTDGN